MPILPTAQTMQVDHVEDELTRGTDQPLNGVMVHSESPVSHLIVTPTVHYLTVITEFVVVLLKPLVGKLAALRLACSESASADCRRKPFATKHAVWQPYWGPAGDIRFWVDRESA